MQRKIWYIGLWVGMIMLLSSCSPCSLREAQGVVTQADSAWYNGQPYADSAALAHSYRQLGYWRRMHADEYAHVCYHYGRLLRQHDNPVEAMQCFINASHAPTHDYHILGRVYSNMGNIAHLADEYSLAYDLFVHAADLFLQNADTLSYYYAMNSAAFELAEQGKKEEVLSITDFIIDNCTNSGLLDRIWETKAEMYRKTEQFDSALFCANYIHQHSAPNSLYHIIKAQSFYRLGIADSALVYAHILISDSLKPYKNKFNALFIISHIDSSLNKNDICEMASQREDLRHFEYEPEKEKLILAVQLLKDDKNRKPDYKWIYSMIAVLVIGGFGIALYVHRKGKKHQLLSQHIDDLETKTEATIESMRKQIEERCAIFEKSSTLKEDLQWGDYTAMCQIMDHQFFFLARKLQNMQCLSEREIRLCVLALLNLSYDQMADMLIYAPNGVGKFKVRVAKKLGTSAKNLREFLINKAILE